MLALSTTQIRLSPSIGDEGDEEETEPTGVSITCRFPDGAAVNAIEMVVFV